MALVKNSAEAGVATGTAVDTTNSGTGGTHFSTVVGSGITYQSTTVFHGTLAIQVAAASGVSTYFSWQSTEISGATNSAAFRCYLYLLALPGGTSEPLLYFRSGTGGTGLFPIQIQATTNRLFCTSDAAAGATQATAAAGLSATTWYRLEIQATNNSGTTTDTVTARVYLGDSTTEQTTLGFTTSAANLGTSTIGSVRIGRPSAIGAAFTVIYDDVAFQTGSTTLIGPESNVAPTSGAGVDQTNVEPYGTVTLSGTDSDSDGTVVTRTWAQTAGSPTVTLAGSGATRTFTAPGTIAGTTLTFSYTVTDNLGASSTPDTMTVAVLPVTERAVIGGVEVPMQIREN